MTNETMTNETDMPDASWELFADLWTLAADWNGTPLLGALAEFPQDRDVVDLQRRGLLTLWSEWAGSTREELQEWVRFTPEGEALGLEMTGRDRYGVLADRPDDLDPDLEALRREAKVSMLVGLSTSFTDGDTKATASRIRVAISLLAEAAALLDDSEWHLEYIQALVSDEFAK